MNPLQVTGVSLVRRLQAQRAPCGQVEPHRQRVVPCLRMLLLMMMQRRAAAAASCSSYVSRLLPEGGSLCRKLSQRCGYEGEVVLGTSELPPRCSRAVMDSKHGLEGSQQAMHDQLSKAEAGTAG